MENNSLKYKIFILILFSLFSVTSNGQSKENLQKPHSILFMLHFSTNKINTLNHTNRFKDAQEVIADDLDKNTSIIADFSLNFKFCPIYFFYDSMYDYVKNKQWNLIEFYDSESLGTNKKISLSQLNNYMIVEIAYPPIMSYPEINVYGKEINNKYTPEYANSREYGVVCYDENFNLLNNKLQYTKIILRNSNAVSNTSGKGYKCNAASKFETKLNQFFK